MYHCCYYLLLKKIINLILKHDNLTELSTTYTTPTTSQATCSFILTTTSNVHSITEKSREMYKITS